MCQYCGGAESIIATLIVGLFAYVKVWITKGA